MMLVKRVLAYKQFGGLRDAYIIIPTCMRTAEILSQLLYEVFGVVHVVPRFLELSWPTIAI